jgi:glutathione S-transferase
MKIHGHPWSINTRKCLAVAAEKGHALPLVLVKLHLGEQRGDAHKRLHPFGRVPVLVDGDYTLFESRAIEAYLDAQLGGAPLAPADRRARARMDQWVGAVDAYVAPHAGVIVRDEIFGRFLGRLEAPRVEAARVELEPVLDVLERALGAAPFLAGDALSIADYHLVPYVEYLQRVPESPTRARPHLVAWWERVAARPAWQRVARTGPQAYEPGVTPETIAAAFA